MAISHFSPRRLLLTGGFAVAVAAAPAIAVFAVPTADTAPLASCPGGEEEDMFTAICVPHTVPNSPFSSIPGNPDLPAINGIPCTGANSGQCIGLAENAEAMGPLPQPRSTISSSP